MERGREGWALQSGLTLASRSLPVCDFCDRLLTPITPISCLSLEPGPGNQIYINKINLGQKHNFQKNGSTEMSSARQCLGDSCAACRQHHRVTRQSSRRSSSKRSRTNNKDGWAQQPARTGRARGPPEVFGRNRAPRALTPRPLPSAAAPPGWHSPGTPRRPGCRRLSGLQRRRSVRAAGTARGHSVWAQRRQGTGALGCTL